MWVGATFYFTWLDGRFSELEDESKNAKPGEKQFVWMVHSGGFYRVERRRIGPGKMPATLHWFKWEAAITWFSGALLLGLLYYGTGGLYLTDPLVSTLSPRAAMLLGLVVLIGGWVVYDVLWSAIGERMPRVALAISLVLLAAIVVLLCSTLSGRAAYLHVGAMLGSIMVANVWARILPAQTAMIRATEQGTTPDFTLGDKAKLRSVHNSYLTFPVLFAMISNHFPGTWGAPHRALVLGLLIGLGMGARHLMIGRGPRRIAWAVPMAGALVAVVLLTAPARLEGSGQAPSPAVAAALAGEGTAPSFGEVQAIVLARCVACHAAAPRITSFGAAPGGVNFEDPARIVRYAPRIRERVVTTRTMPLGNMTGMSEEERLVLARWIGHGAKAE